jgi:hypothetical protein
MKTCRHCGANDDVRHGVCERCRRHPEMVADPTVPEPSTPLIEPAHDRPWVARSAFTGRTRRSPRT